MAPKERARHDMRRRQLLCQLPAWLAAPGLVAAQGAPKLLVFLTTFAKANLADGEADMRRELARLGWREGDNLRLQFRYGDNRPERLDELARALVALQPAVALALDIAAARALMRHSTRLPIVLVYGGGDPVADGLAASLRRPGGQVTGLSMQFDDVRPKTYELARQVAPSARRLAGLFDRQIIPAAQFDAAMAGAGRLAQRVGLEYLPLPVREAGEIEAALRRLTPVHEHVLLVNIDALMFVNYASIATLARTLRLPSGSMHQFYVQAGGLFSYGPDLAAMWLRAVQMADQVLRGQPVGEIPFEQPTRIILTLNRATAASIGLTFPREMLVRADEVIG
jgi:putative tryptophan/tyrosine transport system substrate-binding protein